MGTRVSIREAREGDAPGIARVHVESWRETYAGILPQEYLDGLSAENREERWREILGGVGGANYVAESLEGGIAGFSSGGPERSSESPGWELYAIYLSQSWQGAGLGRRLFAGALEAAEAGESVFTWCISANPSRGFYESLGGEVIGVQHVEIGGAKLEETCYGWRDSGKLKRRLKAEC